MSKFVCFLVLLLPTMAFSQTVVDCDFLYSQRGANLLAAQDCYEKNHENKLLGSEDFFDRSFTNLSTAVAFFEKKAEERLVIDKAFLVLEQAKAFYGESSYYNYWKAVWISFDALEKDRGKLIPTYLFSQIGAIQNLLKSALNEDPTTHFFGPHRVLGVLHTQMPKIAGGDKKYAEQMLKNSYTARPHYHSNPYAYANILYINGQASQAQGILNKFLATPNSAYEPYPNEVLRSLNIEIEIEKKKAQELLNIISDEE
jgi:hypothetical protein